MEISEIKSNMEYIHLRNYQCEDRVSDTEVKIVTYNTKPTEAKQKIREQEKTLAATG